MHTVTKNHSSRSPERIFCDRYHIEKPNPVAEESYPNLLDSALLYVIQQRNEEQHDNKVLQVIELLY